MKETTLTPRRVFEILIVVSILGLSFAVFATEILPAIMDGVEGAM